MTLKILLTGYGPFGKISVNQSWQTVKAVADEWDSTDELMTKEVPVSYDYVKSNIPQLEKEYQPNLVIHVGAGNPDWPNEIHLESCAHSDGYTRLDVVGHAGPTTGPCVLLQTALNIDEVVAQCLQCEGLGGLVFKRSDEAGRYLCEYIYYTSLHECEVEHKKLYALFVHLPPITETCTLQDLKKALKMIIQLCSKQVSAQLS